MSVAAHVRGAAWRGGGGRTDERDVEGEGARLGVFAFPLLGGYPGCGFPYPGRGFPYPGREP